MINWAFIYIELHSNVEFFLKNHLFIFIQLSTDVLGTVLGDGAEDKSGAVLTVVTYRLRRGTYT